MPTPRVLFVDDEPAICSAVSKLLAYHGLHVDTVSTSLEARRVISAGYDAMVIDFRLGSEAGDEVYRSLCSAEPRMADRTIFITGDISEGVHMRIEATGCPMLIKPFEMGLLISLIRGTIIAAAGAETARAEARKSRGSRSA